MVQAVLWYTDSLQRKSTTRAEVRDTHSITDVRFSPNRPRLATSSADKAVRVWEECNVSFSFLYWLCIPFVYNEQLSLFLSHFTPSLYMSILVKQMQTFPVIH